ncbi:MAG: PAS domain S-box protein [Thermoleophilia bacterium]
MRKTGIKIIGDVPWGTHFCQFYQTPKDLIDILVPYFNEGLKNNEFCMWITSEPLEVKDAKIALKNSVNNLDEYINRGQIEILDYSKWYTRTGRFEEDKVLQGWVEKEQMALATGFDGLRLSGNTFWLEKKDWETFSDYEKAVDSVIHKYRMLALCTYSLDKCGAAEVIDVVGNHRFAIIKRAGKWNIIESEERKHLDDMLRKSEERFKDIFAQSPIGIEVYDSSGALLDANKACLDYFGIEDIEDVKGFKLFEDPNITDAVKGKLLEGETARYEAPFDFEKVKESHLYKTTKSGTIHLDVLTTPLELKEEVGPFGYLVQIQDITARKLAEDELEKYQENLEDTIKEHTAELTAANKQLYQEINRRKRVEDKLVQQSRTLESFFKYTITPLAVLDRHFNFIRVNEAYAAACKRDASEFPGHNHFEFYPSDAQIIFEQVVETKEPYQTFARPFSYPDHPEWGVTYWDWTLTPILSDTGEVEFLVFSLKDVTERKQLEVELVRINRALRLLSGINQALIRITDETELLNEACRIAVEVGGHHMAWVAFAEHGEAKTLRPMAHAGSESGYVKSAKLTWADNERGRGPSGTAIRTGKTCTVRNIHTDPSFAPWREEALRRGYQASISLPLISEGRAFGVLNIYAVKPDAFDDKETEILNDLSGDLSFGISALRVRAKREKAEKALSAAYEYTQQLISSANVMIVGLDTAGNVSIFNHAAEKITGYTIEELTGINWFEKIVPKDRYAYVWETFQKYQQETGAMPTTFENPILTKSGEERVISWQNSTSSAPDAEISTISFGIDITEKKKAEKALEETVGRLNEAQRTAHIGSWELDLVDNVLIWSDEIYRIFEIDPKKFGVTYEAFLDAIHPDDREAVNFAYTNSLETKKPYSIDHRLFFPDGRVKYVSESCETFYDEEGKPIRSVGIVQDITERKQLEQQLTESQKMESIGRLAGGIAHDFNNFLTAIQGYIALADTELPPGCSAGKDLAEARAASDRAADLARQLLLFGRRESIEMKPVNLNQVINDLLKILGRLIGEQYSVKTELDDELWIINADTGHLEQVLMNLVVNARDAMPEGGTVVLCTRNVNVDSEVVKTKTGKTESRFVELSVSDNGMGMDEQTQSHSFVPFFTTKEKGKGTGLGLSVVYGIVTQHGGWIDLKSAPAQGSTFSIYFPATEAVPHEPSIEKHDLEDLQGKGERVLLVEDDASIRKLAVRMLSGNGYQVETAADSETAIDIFEREEGDFRLVFSDVILPGMNGVSLCESLLQRNPGLGVLLASGYSDEISLEVIRQKGFPFIHKPYDLIELLRVIREELEKQP